MQKINVYGSFAQALFFSGSATVPKYMLAHYVDLGLSDQEMLLLIHIICKVETNPYPTLEVLSQRMSASSSEIASMLTRLTERKLLTVEQHWNSEKREWYKSYSLIGLFDELADVWAIEKVRQFEQEKSLRENLAEEERKTNLVTKHLVEVFEQELGRPLTGLECEHLDRWLGSGFSDELIIESLRRGVSAGIRNFRYLDSILREWEKKGLKTRTEVEADDADFQARQDKKVRPKGRTVKKATSNKYENFYL